MNRPARVINVSPANDDTPYLGPARVVEQQGASLKVQTPEGFCGNATMALAFPYAPKANDILLVIGREDGLYVIGVLQGRGTSTLAFQGGLELSAQGGPLTLSSDKAVAIRAPEMDIETKTLRMFAGAVTQKFTSLCQRIRDSLTVHAGQAQTMIDDRSYMTAKNASIVTEDTMTINGNQIHLG